MEEHNRYMIPRILVIDDEEGVQKLIFDSLCPPENVRSSKSNLLKLADSLYKSEKVFAQRSTTLLCNIVFTRRTGR